MIRYKRLSKKIDIKDKESARIIKRGKIKELERNANDVEAPVRKDSRPERKSTRANARE